MLLGKYINKYYLRYILLFIIGIAMLVAVDFVQIQIPGLLGKITSIFTNANETGFTDSMKVDVINVIWKVLLIGGVMFLGRIIWRLTLFNASHRIDANLRHEMFLKAEKMPRDYYHQNKVGTIMAWFTTDLETIEEFVGFGTVMLIDGIFMSILTVIYMVRLQWQLTLIVSIPMLLIIVWGIFVEKYMSLRWTERQNSYDELYDFSQESFTGIRVIKAFVKETQQLHAFAKVARKNQNINVRLVKLSVLFDVLIEIIIALICAILLSLGGWFVYQLIAGQDLSVFGFPIVFNGLGPDDKPVSGLISFLGYFDALIWPLIAMGQVISSHSRAKTSLKRITAFLDTPTGIIESKNPIEAKNIKGKIEYKDFSFKYMGSDSYHLKNITLTINPGDRIGVVGKIGSGKTTIVTTLLRLHNVDKGTLFIDGIDIMDYSIESLRNYIAFVPQDNFLFSDTIERNITFSNVDLPHDKVIEAAKFANVHEDIEGFEKGYETVSGERGVTLSGGQKQRISIARAFVKDAPILILDDSVSAVDVKTEEEILKNIHEQRMGKTTIVVASRVSTVAHFDKIIVLVDGELEAFDTPENLLKTSPTYKKMVQLQELEKEVEGGN